MPKVTIKDLRDYLDKYEGQDTDIVYAVITGQPGSEDVQLARFVEEYLQPNLGKMRLGFFACGTLASDFEEAQKLAGSAFYFTTV